ncbi:MAG: NrfD/PsrC family molybdoenzyme membrane anchor subunit, partial [Desulfatiglandales bacterium]
MEEMVYNVFHKLEWGLLIAMYFYFTGLSAGTFVISSMATVMGMEKYKPLAKYAALLAFLLLGSVPFLLILDLGQPLRFWHIMVPTYFHVTSVIAWGTLLLSLYPILCFIYAFYLWIKPEEKKIIRTLGMIGVPLAIAVHAYTGFIFGVIKSRAFWYTALQPAYFLASAFVSGFGLMMLVTLLLNKYGSEETKKAISKSLVYDMGRILSYILAVDFFFVVSQILITLHGNVESVLAVTFALKDPIYLWGEIVAGLIIPYIILVLPRTKRNLSWVTVAAVLVLIGVAFVRWSIVHIGQ